MTTCITEGCNKPRVENRRICSACKYKRNLLTRNKRVAPDDKVRLRESEKPLQEEELFGGSKLCGLLSAPL